MVEHSALTRITRVRFSPLLPKGFIMKLIQLKNKDKKIWRNKLLKKQKGICLLTGKEIEEGKATLDHKHKMFADEEIGHNGAGLIRGVLDFRANSFEGKVFNNYRRLGLHKIVGLPTLLRNLADYLERKCLPLIHPSEAPPPKYIKKSCYNKLVKVAKKQKIPVFHKKQKLTKKLQFLFRKYHVKIEYYK